MHPAFGQGQHREESGSSAGFRGGESLPVWEAGCVQEVWCGEGEDLGDLEDNVISDIHQSGVEEPRKDAGVFHSCKQLKNSG